MITDTAAQRRQNEILKVAIDLFIERGYEGVSVDAIVEQTGGSKTTVYSYYGGKEALFMAAIEALTIEMLEPLCRLQVAHLPPQEGLTILGRQFLTTLACPRGIALFHTVLAQSRQFPGLSKRFYDAGPKVFKRLVSRTMAQWQEQGLLRCGNPELLTEQFLSVVLGGWNMRMLLGLAGPLSVREIRNLVAHGTDTFLHGSAQTGASNANV